MKIAITEKGSTRSTWDIARNKIWFYPMWRKSGQYLNICILEVTQGKHTSFFFICNSPPPPQRKIPSIKGFFVVQGVLVVQPLKKLFLFCVFLPSYRVNWRKVGRKVIISLKLFEYKRSIFCVFYSVSYRGFHEKGTLSYLFAPGIDR